MAALNAATAKAIRNGPRNAEALDTGRRANTRAQDKTPASIQITIAMMMRAIQRHTGVSAISNLTNCCGSFFSNGVSDTTSCALGINGMLSDATSQAW